MALEWTMDLLLAHHHASLPFSLVNCFIIIIATTIIISIFYYNFHSSQSLLPTYWPVIGMFPALMSHIHHVHDYVSAAIHEAGYTFMFKGPWLFGMDLLVTCDPANVHHVFSASFANYPKGEEFVEMFEVFGGGLFGVDGESWRLQRKIMHSLTRSRDMRSFMLDATLDKAERGLLPLLEQVAASGMVVDMESVFTRVTFDATYFSVFGVDPCSLSIEFPTVPLALAIDDFWVSVLFRHAVPRSWWRLMKWMRVGPERKMAEAAEVIDKLITQQISHKRKEKENNTVDLLTYYINEATSELKAMFTSEDKFLRDAALFLIIAGRDAFGITLSWLFWLLSKNPEAEVKIIDEIRGLRKEHSTRSVFDVEEVSRMVYLHGAVLETLRLYPPVPFEHKAALRPDVLPTGHRLAAGTKILFSVYAMGRMEVSWGKDCMEFKPGRWITEEGRTKHEPANKFMAFNSGPRSCLGKEIGLAQVKLVAAAAIWNFEVVPVEGHLVEPKISGMIRMKNGMMATVRKRRI